ncbi:MAG: single-stranded-DNA-specific exonuclease RecJ [Candidatus Bipolaricaulia bacterium]
MTTMWQSLFADRCWQLEPSDRGQVDRILKTLGGPPALARVLAIRRESRDLNGLERLLICELQLEDPFLIAGMDRAVERLARGAKLGERIFIHGDFDTDGITAAALLYLGLARMADPKRIRVELEDRDRGHGLNAKVVRRILRGGFDLVITSDCGISDRDEVATLQEHGVDVIITDHHRPPQHLPPAIAVLNPKRKNDPYPNKSLAGVGVAFKLISAFYQHLDLSDRETHRYLDLTMLGTVADLVPLVANDQFENRSIVMHGLKQIASGEGNLGLRVLIERLALAPQRISVGGIGYRVAPRINAANRAGDPRVAFLLLITRNPKRAEYLAEILMDYNRDRQVAQDDLLYRIEEQLSRRDLAGDPILIIDGEGWNPGVIGLVASKLVDQYDKPVVLISIGDRVSRGSCRSIPGFDVGAALEQCTDLLENHGGHLMAAGFTIRNEHLKRFNRELVAYAHRVLSEAEEMGTPVTQLDARVEAEEIDLDLYHELQRLGPFGVGNPAPRLLLTDAILTEVGTVGGGQHLKLQVRKDGQRFEAIGFDMGGYQLSKLSRVPAVSLVFKLRVNDWGGVERVQLELQDIVSEDRKT